MTKTEKQYLLLTVHGCADIAVDTNPFELDLPAIRAKHPDAYGLTLLVRQMGETDWTEVGSVYFQNEENL